MEIINAIKIFFLGTVGFFLAFFSTPALTNFLYKHKMWRKTVRDKSIDGKEIPFFKKFHSDKETNVPRLGGVLVWASVLILSFVFLLLSKIFPGEWIEKMNFLSREQTWLPLFTLVVASLIGLLDDLLQIIDIPSSKLWQKLNKHVGGGLSLRYRLFLMGILGAIGSYWFYYKLGWQSISIPGMGDFTIGIWYLPLFVLVMVATYSGGVIDGLDGLAGGSFALMFGAFSLIAFLQNQINLASFCAVVMGAILAFLWFNIPPARFYLGETGTMGLTATLAVIAFLTNSVVVLPIIAFLLVLESSSVILQLLWRKVFKKKLFLAAPLHHHFEAQNWPSYKVTMRFWVIGAIAAIVGTMIKMLG